MDQARDDAAGFAVAQTPAGTSFNPLLIYGGVGLGKTHLAHAIGIKIKELHPEKTVLYVSAEKFTQQFLFLQVSQVVKAL